MERSKKHTKKWAPLRDGVERAQRINVSKIVCQQYAEDNTMDI